MEVNSLKMAKVFSGGGEVHYVLPHFQREYAWDKEQWQTLLDDILSIYEVYDPDNEPEHFLGALVVVRDGMRSGTIPAFKLVDGQQRLTTISLFLCALGRLVEDSHPALNKKIRKLLENADEDGLIRLKLVPTIKYGDRDAYFALIEGSDISDGESKIVPAFNFVHAQLQNRIGAGQLDPERLFLVLVNCIHVVFIDLDQRERPYEIFESLNAKGKGLGQPDLVRNYIAMKLPENAQEDVFQMYWSDIESRLRETRSVSRIGELTAFLRHYLAYRTGVLVNKGHVYARFRDRMEREFRTVEAFSDEIKTLRRFAEYYDTFLRPEQEQDFELRTALERLSVLESATAYPFLLGVYDLYHQRAIARDELRDVLYAIENYLVRRFLAGERSGYTNKMFPILGRELDRSRYVLSLKQALTRKNYPSDNRIRQVVTTAPIYDKRSPQRLMLILETINRFLSEGSGGHTVLDDSATIEHIMPQSLDNIWKRGLGQNWEEIHQDYVHTIGNLTLVTQEWNSSMSNAPFSEKRRRLAGHALLLNRNYFSSDILNWNDVAIRERAEFLANSMLQIWPSFGESPTSAVVDGQKPVALVVLGETHKVRSWRDVAWNMANCVANLVDDFDSIAHEIPRFFSQQPRERAKQMENGWWMYINLSRMNVLYLCDMLASRAELSNEDWEITFVESSDNKSEHNEDD